MVHSVYVRLCAGVGVQGGYPHQCGWVDARDVQMVGVCGLLLSQELRHNVG